MKILFNEYQIQAAINSVAAKIHKKHYNDPTPPVMICVLNGGFMFFTELVKQVRLDCEIDFIKVKSYKNKEQYQPTIINPIDVDISNKTVYIIDDILDSGKTMDSILNYLHTTTKTPPKETIPVTLFKRYDCNTDSITGIILTNELWLCGYGLDASNNLMRNRTVVFGETSEIE
jgi:hypoxanthine phosphoribosyltransferase